MAVDPAQIGEHEITPDDGGIVARQTGFRKNGRGKFRQRGIVDIDGGV